MESEEQRDLGASWVLLEQDGRELDRTRTISSSILSREELSLSLAEHFDSSSLSSSNFPGSPILLTPKTEAALGIGASLIEDATQGGEGKEAESTITAAGAAAAGGGAGDGEGEHKARSAKDKEEASPSAAADDAWWRRMVTILLKHFRSGLNALSLNKPGGLASHPRLFLVIVPATVAAAVFVGVALHSSSSPSTSRSCRSRGPESTCRTSSLSTSANPFHVRVL